MWPDTDAVKTATDSYTAAEVGKAAKQAAPSRSRAAAVPAQAGRAAQSAASKVAIEAKSNPGTSGSVAGLGLVGLVVVAGAVLTVGSGGKDAAKRVPPQGKDVAAKVQQAVPEAKKAVKSGSHPSTPFPKPWATCS